MATPRDPEVGHAIAGDGGPWIVLVHCLGGSRDIWWQSVPRLARSYRVLTLDLRGHGSTASPGPWTMEDLADDTARLLTFVGAPRATVVGAAMGGMVAQLLAARYPERVERLVLANTSSHVDAAGASSFRDRAARARAEGLAGIAADGVRRYFTDRAPAALVDRVRTIWAAMEREAYAYTCEAIAGFDARSRAERIVAPALVIGSEEDPTSRPERSRELAAALPDARVEIMARGAHLACVEEASTFTALVEAFLKA